MNKTFATEADLCSGFMAWVRAERRCAGWTPYPETAGWDILLVHTDGTQIGVQAKLRLNVAVLEQAVEDGYWPHDTGPDFRAVLVPYGQAGHMLATALGLTVFEPCGAHAVTDFRPDIEVRDPYPPWHFCNPARRHELPRFVPDVVAGASGPTQLTKWKIAALEVCAVLELQGYVTRETFKRYRIDHRRWTQHWLEAVPGQPGRWREKDGGALAFRAQHPDVYAKVKDEVRADLRGKDLLGEAA